MALSSSVLAARCSMVLTLTWYFGAWTWAVTVCVRELEPIRPPRQHLLIGHPDDRRLELIGDFRRIVGLRDHIAARAVDLIARSTSVTDWPATASLADHRPRSTIRLTVEVLPEGSTRIGIARLDAAARDQPAEAAKIEIRVD